MNHKKLIYLGIAILSSSIIIGTLGTVWGIFSSFQGLRVSESAGIGAVSSGVASAILFTVFAIVGIVSGLILIIVGILKERRNESLK